MTLTISLPTDAESRLRERARAAGQDVTQYVEQLITRELEAPLAPAEAAEPLARAVDAAGVTDDEFTSLLVGARNAARRDRDSRFRYGRLVITPEMGRKMDCPIPPADADL